MLLKMLRTFLIPELLLLNLSVTPTSNKTALPATAIEMSDSF
jgi:hypothetical protein